MAEGGAMATSSEVTASVVKDRDPPPSFDGDPNQFKQYEKEVQLWQWETDIPKVKHAVKLLRNLSGAARSAADEVSVEDLQSEGGVKAIMARLREHFQPHLEAAMPRAFEKAIYGESRRAKETMQEYIIRMDRGFKELLDEGVQLNDTVKGYVIYRQANLAGAQEDQVTTWTAGKYDRESIVKALRKLEKIQKDKVGSKSYLVDDEEGDTYVLENYVENDEEIENYVYVGEGDLDQVFEEADLHEALATYQQVRKAIRDQRTSRSWQPATKGGGKVGFGGNGKGGLRFHGKGSRVHVESLKLRTRCARCGVIGHWAKECQGVPDEYARQRQASQSASKSGANNMVGKSGFVQVGTSSGSHFVMFQHFQHVCPTIGDFYKTKNLEVRESFNGITTGAEQGVVDTAAQSGLIGEAAYERLRRSLASCGLKPRETNRVGQARGVGGKAVSLKVVEIPIGIAGINGVLETTVVKDEVPLLLPVSMLRDLQAQVDLCGNRLKLAKFGKETPMSIMSSGHVTVNVLEFDSEGWSLPREAAVLGMSDFDFRVDLAVDEKLLSSPAPTSKSVESASYHVAMGPTPTTTRRSDGAGWRRWGGPDGVSSSPGVSKMEAGVDARDRDGAQLREVSVRASTRNRPARGGGALARRWLSIWLCAAACMGTDGASLGECSRAHQQARGVCSQDSTWNPAASEEECPRGHGVSSSMHTPCQQPGWSRKPASTRGVVPRLSEPMEGGDAHTGTIQGTSEDADEDCWDSTVASNPEEQEQSNTQQDIPRQPNPEVVPISIPSIHSSSIDGIDAGGSAAASSEVRVSSTSTAVYSQEARTNEGSSLLPLQPEDVRVLLVGSSRDSAVEDSRQDASNTTGGAARGDGWVTEDGGGNDDTNEGQGRGIDQQGKGFARGASPCKPECTEAHRSSNGSRRPQASGDHGGSEETASSRHGEDARPDGVAHCGSWRREGGSGDAGSTSPRRGVSEGNGAEEVHHAATTPGRWWGDLRRDLTEAEADEVWRSAPWAYELQDGGRDSHVLRKIQLEDWYEPEEVRRVQHVWWSQEEGGGDWKFHTGIFPEPNSLAKTRVFAVVEEEAGQWTEDLDEVYGVLNRKSRRRIEKALKQVVVSEVYSEPRVSQMAMEKGMKGGTCFDLKTGFDLSTRRDRARAWKTLKEEDPDLVVVCPPCGPFSQMQALNYPNMSLEKAMYLLGEGLEHLNFAMKVLEWQVRRGKLGLFEHPDGSKAWHEECVQRVMRIPGMRRVVGDQCEFGLRVRKDEDLSKKPTGFLTNGERIAAKLSIRCSGKHEHQKLEGGRAKGAEQYPPKLCEAIVEGLREDSRKRSWLVVIESDERTFAAEDDEDEGDLEEALDQAVEEAGERLPGDMARPPQKEEDSDEGEDEMEDEVSRGNQVPRGVSEADKRKIRKLHANLGHPSRGDFVRALRMARAREEVWKYVQKDFHCDVCEAQQKPKLNRPATIPRSYAPGRVVGVDVVFFPGVKPNETIPVLNVTDWGSCYQTLEPLEGMASEKVWWKFMKSWGRNFGIPEMVVVDQGREFLGEFSKRVNEAGAVVKTIGARAPHQQGRTERHGGLAKSMFLKMREEMMPQDREDWEAMVYAVEAAKNRLYNRSGFSAAQRQLGQNIRIPGSLGSDDPFESALTALSAGAEVGRMIQMRELAMDAFLKQTTRDALKRAEKAKPRVRRDLNPGEVVYVYRKPLMRRSIRSPSDTKRAQWVGPGTVIICEGPNVWVAMRGEVWKCAKEQVRPATMEEEEAYGLLREELEDLKEEIKRRSSKRGFKDISRMAAPPEEGPEEGEEEPVEPVRQRARREEPDQPEGGSSTAQQPEETSQESSSSSSTSQDEPEGERIDEAHMDQAVRSAIHNEMLDGTLRISASEAYEPKRARLEKMRFKPYPHEGMYGESALKAPKAYISETPVVGFHMRYPEEGQDLETEDQEEDEDFWVLDEFRRKLIRVHRQERKGNFCPRAQKGCPIAVNLLTSRCQQRKIYPDETVVEREVDWRSRDQEERGPRRFWTGSTEFSLKKGVKIEKVKTHLLASKGGDEVKEQDIKPDEWPEWRKADAAEWEKVASTSAVRTMTVEESLDVAKQLEECGKAARILPTRIVRRWKPAELPGEKPKMKSRWCIRGDRDPDLMYLDRYAPTATTSVISIALQVGASHKFRCALGDLQNAFMQSDPLKREQGRLFCKQPSGGLPGLDPRQLIEVLAGAYGLGDAPAHWRKSLKRVLVELGYKQSSMDPCLFTLVVDGRLAGMLIIEVDDILSLGLEAHYQKMEELQTKLKFGKFKFLDEEPNGASFNGRRLRATPEGGFKIDMEKFVTERLQEVQLAPERIKDKTSAATEKERGDARAALGALTWAAKEGRPDCAAAASLIASTLSKMTVQDVADLNKVIKEVKESAAQCIQIQPIEPSRLCWGVITDASYANASGGASQGAYGVICYDEDLLHQGRGKANLIHWKSNKIHRVVNSTLAAEAQSLSRGLSELAWTVTIYNEIVNPSFKLSEWHREIKGNRMHVLTKTNVEERLRRGLCVVDAKSLYDHLVKETIGTTADKRTAIEMQVIRQSMEETGSIVKWVPHEKMTMDCLTKKHGNRAPLTEFLSNGILDFRQDGQQEFAGVCEST